jgi:hypothetical protein
MENNISQEPAIVSRDFKGIWIPREIWFDGRLSFTEKCLLAEIDSLDNGMGCSASNKYLSGFFGISERQIRSGISHLTELKYLSLESFDGRRRFLRSNGGFRGERKKTSGRGGGKLPGAIYDNKDDNKEEKEPKPAESQLDKDVLLFWGYFLLKTKRAFKLTEDKKKLIKQCLLEHPLGELKEAVDAFVADPWPERKRYMDLMYCIGKQRGKPDNLERWLAAAQEKKVKKPRYE